MDSPRISAPLNTIHDQAPTLAVFVDLSTGRNVAREGESVVLPVYRALLERLGYSAISSSPSSSSISRAMVSSRSSSATSPPSRNARGSSAETWGSQGEASHALHLLRPETYPEVDSWARQATEPEINANRFAVRAKELVARRGDGATRLVFVVDEVGQYVARSVDRMLDLQGLAEAVQKHRGQPWLVVTRKNG